MNEKIELQEMIEAYKNGKSLNAIAHSFGTYPTTIKRILERNNVELRHDAPVKGSHVVLNDGEKLIEWAKAQGRLVTRRELAKVAGKTRLSSSYFQKYPELGRYIVSYDQQDIKKYIEQLFAWLQKNNISYAPSDRSALGGIPVQAKLLGEYEGIVIVVDIKAHTLSNIQYKEMINKRLKKAKEKGVALLFLRKEHFKDLDCVKDLLDGLKYSKEK